MARHSVTVKLNFPSLASSTSEAVNEATTKIARRAGDGFIGDVIWTDRPHGAVRATTYKARLRNARENTLLKAATNE
ncbi:hypothetical protein [Actinobaculum sp. 352]|uniref:hypothetical protein n=1 Tax=Actinobaculum sp. 352 TaxID=2490946 RepID=UPI000F7DB2F4|nr:hypothetical protein [Actinobaculum sp. 352]RTE47733.1 hypothetical protein EKN07_12145 [Actinobaculum sp. 352]